MQQGLADTKSVTETKRKLNVNKKLRNWTCFFEDNLVFLWVTVRINCADCKREGNGCLIDMEFPIQLLTLPSSTWVKTKPASFSLYS